MQISPKSLDKNQDNSKKKLSEHYFAGRQDLIQVFERSLKQVPPIPVLMYFGIGGIGKTTLLHFLMDRFCCAPEGKADGYPYVSLDLRSSHSSLSPDRFLWQARQQLKRYKLHYSFPRFDLIWGKMWERTYQMPLKRNKELVTDEMFLISELLQGSELIPVIGEAMKAVELLNQLTHRAKDVFIQHNLSGWFKEKVEKPTGLGWKTALNSMELGDLEDLMSQAFAADLSDNVAIQKAPKDRVIIFIDNYEVLNEILGEYFDREKPNFIQIFSKELIQLRANVLTVISGRDPLRWSEVQRRDGTWVIDPSSIWAQEITHRDNRYYISRYLEKYSLDVLSETDSIKYLNKRHRYPDQTLPCTIYEFTYGYPLALGIAADLFCVEGERAFLDFKNLKIRLGDYKHFSDEWRTEVNDWLLEKLLEQLEFNHNMPLINLIKAAAVSRFFNQELLFYLTQDPGVSEQFRRLVGYSFVEPYKIENRQYFRLHSVIRRLLRQDPDIRIVIESWEQEAAEWFNKQANAISGTLKWRYRFELLYHMWHYSQNEALNKVSVWFSNLQTTNEDELTFELLNTASETEPVLPYHIRAQLNLYRSALALKLWNDKGSNRETALQHAEKALEQAQETTDRRLLANAHLAVSHALLHKAMGISDDSGHNFLKALNILEQGWGVSVAANYNSGLASILILRATIETELNPDFGNLNLIDQAICLYEQTEDSHGQRNAYFSRAIIAMRIQAFDQVLLSLSKAEELDILFPTTDELWKADLNQLYGEYYAECQEWRKARQYLEMSKDIYKKYYYLSGICAATGWSGVVHCHLGNMTFGLDLLHEALQIEHDILGSREGVAKWLHLIGEIFLKNKELARALNALLLCLSLREEMRHSEASKTSKLIFRINNEIPELLLKSKDEEFNPYQSEFGKYAFLWGFNTLIKHPTNPVLIPLGTDWEAYSTYNPAAWANEKQVYLFYRAEGKTNDQSTDLTSKIGLAVSEDGIHFKRENRPIIEPTEQYEFSGGCEDPRLIRLNDSFYITYTAYDGKTARLCLAKSDDLLIWKKLGPLFPDEKWEAYFPSKKYRDLFPRGWSKAGAILNRAINEYYWMYFGDTHIWIAYSKDLLSWEVIEEPVLSPRPNSFDSRLVEPGPPPVILPEGIWLGYNGADGNLRYSFGQALFSHSDPRKLIRRCSKPLLEPTTEFEMKGKMPNVTFAEGLVKFRGKWHLYYGMADTRIGLAWAKGISE